MARARRVALLDPLAVIGGRPSMFLRNHFGSPAPLSLCAYPPLELATAAALLRREGIGFELVAANVLGWRHPRVVEHLKAAPPDLILIPSAWQSGPDDLVLAGLLRAAFPQARLLLSGPNVAAAPETFLVEGGAHFVALSDPEDALLRLAKGEDPAAVPNLAFREGEAVRRVAGPLPDWPSYPLPARDLLDLDKYWIPFSKRLPSTTMETVRGCPHHCNFCPTHIWNKREIRARPVPRVLEEIDELVARHGIREIIIRDDTFTWDRARVLAICEGLKARGRDLTWRCFATVSTVDEELLRRMADAGCVQVCFGFESGDDRVLKRIGKGTTVAQGRDAVRWAKAAGLEVSGTFMVGYEGETREMRDASIAFAVDNDLDYAQVTPATPLAGTPFGRRAAALDDEELGRETRRFHRAFYLRPGYILRRALSGRRVPNLLRHARLGLRLASYAVLGWSYDQSLGAGAKK